MSVHVQHTGVSGLLWSDQATNGYAEGIPENDEQPVFIRWGYGIRYGAYVW